MPAICTVSQLKFENTALRNAENSSKPDVIHPRPLVKPPMQTAFSKKTVAQPALRPKISTCAAGSPAGGFGVAP